MPAGLEHLVNYGVLGLLVLFGLWGGVRLIVWTGNQLFSRDEKQLGLVTMKVQSSCEKDRKMVDFMDALSAREIKQQELCERHNAGLVQISQTLAEHHSASSVARDDVAKLKACAREACQLARALATHEWPASRDAVEQHCSKIEHIIDSTT